MTEEEKKAMRIAIAKDVLKNLKKLKVDTGSYLSNLCLVRALPAFTSLDNAQKYLPKMEEVCEVCALGACFLSHVRIFDKVTMALVGACYEDVTLPLLEYFSKEQLDHMEVAFEGWNAYADFKILYPNNKQRLRKIMQSVAKYGELRL